MPLQIGTRIGPYEIVAPLGFGGMGEVYRATDTSLGREVAIKVLPDAFAQDADRLARFQREAKTLASLNHPHIAQIYGLEKSSGVQPPPQGSGEPGRSSQSAVRALVMELVEGEDLSQWIARGPIPLGDALRIAKQIADALDAAPEHGIIHRDLKPANIKVRPDGTVKVLDFGLAKAMDASGSAGDSAGLSNSPTLSVHATYAGVILGTACYMSPEQARGKPVDTRTDLWAFGCVLYEMITGRQAFAGGDTVSDAVAAILKGDVDWAALPAATPDSVRRLLRRCLEKDRTRRLQSAADVRIEVEDVIQDETGRGAAPMAAPARPRTRERMAWMSVALLANPVWSPDGNRIVFGSSQKGVMDLYQKQANGAGPEELLLESPQPKASLDWSSDGRFVLYGVNDPKAGQDLWVLPMEGDAKPFAFLNSSFSERLGQFSPDVRWVAYQSDESGRNEIYVRPFPGPGGQWQVSTTGGIAPQWRKDGRELYYIAPDGKLMATPIAVKDTALEPGIPVPLFQTRIVYGGASAVGVGRQYDVASDGRFLINVTTDDGSTAPITVIQNWKPGN